MTQYFNIHPENPQQRLIDQTADLLRKGAVVALPTDSCYSLACHLGDAGALDKIRKIRGIDDQVWFRIYHPDKSFTDYELTHHDCEIVIIDKSAALIHNDAGDFLDYTDDSMRIVK